jgi:hypothetical protein
MAHTNEDQEPSLLSLFLISFVLQPAAKLQYLHRPLSFGNDRRAPRSSVVVERQELASTLLCRRGRGQRVRQYPGYNTRRPHIRADCRRAWASRLSRRRGARIGLKRA